MDPFKGTLNLDLFSLMFFLGGPRVIIGCRCRCYFVFVVAPVLLLLVLLLLLSLLLLLFWTSWR